MVETVSFNPRLCVRQCENDGDFDVARSLCRGFVSWLYETFPDKHETFDGYFEPVEWEKTLAALPHLHARPKGNILIAFLEEEPVGCIMYQPLVKETGEVKRLFVTSAARGTGAGKALVEAVIEAARSDGYASLQLDTGQFLQSALALYARCGFAQMPTPRRRRKAIAKSASSCAVKSDLRQKNGNFRN